MFKIQRLRVIEIAPGSCSRYGRSCSSCPCLSRTSRWPVTAPVPGLGAGGVHQYARARGRRAVHHRHALVVVGDVGLAALAALGRAMFQRGLFGLALAGFVGGDADGARAGRRRSRPSAWSSAVGRARFARCRPGDASGRGWALLAWRAGGVGHENRRAALFGRPGRGRRGAASPAGKAVSTHACVASQVSRTSIGMPRARLARCWQAGPRRTFILPRSQPSQLGNRALLCSRRAFAPSSGQHGLRVRFIETAALSVTKRLREALVQHLLPTIPAPACPG